MASSQGEGLSPETGTSNETDRAEQTWMEKTKRMLKYQGGKWLQEMPNLLTIAALALVGMFGVDEGFDSEMPINREFPGQVVSFQMTLNSSDLCNCSLSSSEEYTVTKYTFLKDPRFDQIHIPDPQVNVDGTWLTILSGPFVFLYVLLFHIGFWFRGHYRGTPETPEEAMESENHPSGSGKTTGNSTTMTTTKLNPPTTTTTTTATASSRRKMSSDDDEIDETTNETKKQSSSPAKSKRRKPTQMFFRKDMISFLYAYVIGMSLVYLSSKSIKYYVAWPRPDFYARCKLDPLIYSMDLSGYADDPVTGKRKNLNDFESFCRATYPDASDKEQDDWRKAWESFVSGHAAYMFTAWSIVTYWSIAKICYSRENASHLGLNQHRMRVKFTRCGNVSRKFDHNLILKLILSAPLWVAAWVGLTRIVDNRHFPTDTVAGTLLGLVCGYFAYSSQFPWTLPDAWRVLRDKYQFKINTLRYRKNQGLSKV